LALVTALQSLARFLLHSDKTSHFVTLDFGHRNPMNSGFQKPLATLADRQDQITQTVAVQERYPLGRPDAHPFQQQPEGKHGRGQINPHVAQQFDALGPRFAAVGAALALVAFAVFAELLGCSV
jgi:hypothetical protein